MSNKILYGIKNVYVAKLTEADDGTISYGTPFAMPGAVGFSPEPQGETTTFYADDMAYYIAQSNSGYQGDLELAITPNQFITAILGQTQDSNGALIENSDDRVARFALMFEGEGDTAGRRWVYYDCTATRPNREHSTTEESIEVGTETMTITIKPRSSDRAIKAVMERTEENAAVYDGFFDTVYETPTSI